MMIATKEHSFYAFAVIEERFLRGSDDAALKVAYKLEDGRAGIFVTLKKRASKKGKSYEELRGCIGSLSPIKVSGNLGIYALKSAFNDHRFDPLQQSEMADLEIGVSFLTNFETAKNLNDWTVGVHGIIIEFSTKKQRYSATYLPEVSEEQGWSKDEAIASLVKKSGFRGEITPDLLSLITLTRYISSKEKANFDEYQSWKSSSSAS